MVNAPRDLVGQRFGQLFVLARVLRKSGVYWKCECDCGTIRKFAERRLIYYKTQSCGCVGRRNAVEKTFKHGHSNEPEYAIWRLMIRKCINPQTTGWANCGAKGISVTQSWVDDYENFIKDIGNRPGQYYRLTRRDLSKDFTKENCYWRKNKFQPGTDE